MAALSSGPLLTTASKTLHPKFSASSLRFARSSQNSVSHFLGHVPYHMGWCAPRCSQSPGHALRPGPACCALLEAQRISSARNSPIGFQCTDWGGSGEHVNSGTANLWFPDSRVKETGPEILCSAVGVSPLCTAPLEHSPVFDKFAEDPLPIFVRIKCNSE